MTGAPLLPLRHAIENASHHPVTDADIVALLQGAAGRGGQRRALFGDTSLQSLARAGASVGVPLPVILAAYAAARDTEAAVNPELDRALQQPW